MADPCLFVWTGLPAPDRRSGACALLFGIAQRDYVEIVRFGVQGRQVIRDSGAQIVSISYRIALAPRASRNSHARLAKATGFSLHAGVAARADQRDKLKRPGGDLLCRYISRPAIAEKRLSLTSSGQIRSLLKIPYRDGITNVILSPLDFLARHSWIFSA